MAALRIAAGLASLITSFGLAKFVVPPPNLRFPPPGTGWLGFLPVSQEAFSIALFVLGVAGVMLVLGYRARIAALVGASALFYAGWLTTLTGKVDHFHHVLWVLLIVAVSPSSETWAIRKERGRGSYSLPVFAVILMIGIIYFGAGIQKLVSAGFAWGWSDNLTNLVLHFSYKNDLEPSAILLDPTVSRLLGTGALAFELLFLPLVLVPQARKYVWPVGLVFHSAVWLVLGITFLTLPLLYVVFMPWDQGQRRVATTIQRRSIAGLLVAVLVFGLVGVDHAWPVAAYPGFEGIRGPTLVAYEIRGVGNDRDLARGDRDLALLSAALEAGKEEELLAWLGGQSIWRLKIDVTDSEVVERLKVFP